MGTVTIQRFTYKNPISMIGEEAGVCWSADTSDPEKNYKRGLDCLENEHGRTFQLLRYACYLYPLSDAGIAF